MAEGVQLVGTGSQQESCTEKDGGRGENLPLGGQMFVIHGPVPGLSEEGTAQVRMQLPLELQAECALNINSCPWI